jgi:molybdopterin adenylyltransferase
MSTPRTSADWKIRVGIITVSDRSARGEREDASGPSLVSRVQAEGWEVVRTEVLPDDLERLSATLRLWADEDQIDLILTTGGTGFAPRDVTPEATLAILDRLAPGIPEAMRAASLRLTPHAMLSRQVAGIRKHTIIVNLPGSPKGAFENLDVIVPALQHAVDLLRGDPRAQSGHGSH